jgi:tetratricopeptide (TPR) repeat protein
MIQFTSSSSSRSLILGFSKIILITLLEILITFVSLTQIEASSEMKTPENNTLVRIAPLSTEAMAIRNTNPADGDSQRDGDETSLHYKHTSNSVDHQNEEATDVEEESQSDTNIGSLLDEGDALYNISEYDGAISYYDRVLSIDQDNIYAMNSKVAALLNIGKYEEAIDYADIVLEMDPANLAALNNMGFALSDLGRNEEAITYYDRALEIDPARETALINKGVALHYLDRNEEAITYYDKALEIDPSDTLVLNNKGGALAALGRYEEAITYYDKVLVIDPDNEAAQDAKLFALEQLHG